MIGLEKREDLQEHDSCGNSLEVQWLGLCTLSAEGLGSFPGRGTKIPQATRRGQKQQEQQQEKF